MALVGPCAIEATRAASPQDVVAIVEELRARAAVESVVVAFSGRRAHLPPLDVSVTQLPEDGRPLELVVASLPEVRGRCVVLLRVADGGYEVAAGGWDTRTPWEILVPADEPASPLSSGSAAPAPGGGPAPSP
ncbi:MAG: hypothetical protein KC621_34830 [Myxococcales bacterium]|nr:hypothetical protein [Myxococcales bacterium]